MIVDHCDGTTGLGAGYMVIPQSCVSYIVVFPFWKMQLVYYCIKVIRGHGYLIYFILFCNLCEWKKLFNNPGTQGDPLSDRTK